MDRQLIGALWRGHARRATRLRFGKAKMRALAATVFDAAWYLERNSDVAVKGRDPLKHYLRHGWKEDRQPAPWFDVDLYRRANPDVGLGVNPFLHYLKHGIGEGRPLAPIKRKGNKLALPVPQCAKVGRIAVYTAIVGDYDPLKWPDVIGENVDYICYTDQEIAHPGIWQLRALPYVDADPTRSARYVKLNPHLLLPEYPWSVWIDGSVGLACDPAALIDAAKPLQMYLHPDRRCTYDEAEMVRFLGRDDLAVIDRQVERYRRDGMPEGQGLFETGVIVRRHNEPDVKAFDRRWWAEVASASKRDQVALGYVQWKTGMRIDRLAPRGISARNDPRMRFAKHKRGGGPSVEAQRALTVAAKQRLDGHAALPRMIASGRVSVDVVICVKDALDYVRACLDSVMTTLDRGARLIVVDDGSGIEARDYLDWRLDGDRATVIHLPENGGYTRAANVGLEKTTGEGAED